MKADDISPKQFLKARRPEKFSDTVREETPTLDRSMLEYHLDRLTSRKQEVQFERFAQRLLEQEVCPNLLPQTGPTGGGDSKVDSETYPVADDLSLVWYTGGGREAASERWAFAFSAKKEWRDKVRSDVAKIAETARDYRKAFFVSNQFISDRTRAEMEDELRDEHNLDVRIFDRTWILNKVFGNRHEALAIDELELAVETRKHVDKGPLDIQRERELEEVEERIQHAVQEQRFGPPLVDDCIHAAALSRGLEHPRTETEGRFGRAERIAGKYGTPHQRLECAYQSAWTAFWWHEDYEHFASLYGPAEDRAKGSRNAYDLELLTNLWFLLHAAVLRGALDEVQADFQAHTDTLTGELQRLSQEENRPSTALQAQTLLLLVQLNLNVARQEPMDPTLRNLEAVVRRCEGLAGYPLEPLANIVVELGDFLHDVPGYDELFETIIEVASARKEEVTAARMLLKRGEQHLEADRPYDAIRSLGRALRGLYKHESRRDAVRALYLCACAYERVRLLWAARGTLLSAASLATDELWRYGDVTLPQAFCYSRLKWVELQLGRLPQTLAWHEADRVVRSNLADQGYDETRLFEGEAEFDLILGILLLKTDVWELKRLSALPDVLESLGLAAASIALIYALGHEEQLEDEEYGEAFANEEPHTVFLKWRDQPAASDLPERPSLYAERKVTLSSHLLGCQIAVQSDNVSPCVELAESVLGALESLLSTGAADRMMTHEPVVDITVRKSDFGRHPFDFELDDRSGRPHVTVSCAEFDPHTMSLEEQDEIHEKLFGLLTTIIARILIIDDPERFFEKLFGEELALDRSVGFTGSFVTVGNVLGYEPKVRISDWSDPQARQYPLMRSKAWDADDARVEEESSRAERSPLTPGEGEPPLDMLDLTRTKHTQIRTISLIRDTLWDQAKWCGTAFFTSPDGSSPPVLAPVFEDPKAADQIFAQWRGELGLCDEDERLRITIVRGIDKTQPHWYRVVIGSNPDVALSQPDLQYAGLVSRLCTMEAESGLNLERFLRSYEALGSYLLAPAAAGDRMSELQVIPDHHLIKRQLHVREAWEVGRHDMDAAAISEDDAPIIPDGQSEPPVLDLLRWKREQSSS